MGVQDGEGNEDEEGAMVQATFINDSRAYVSVHGFWKWGTFDNFDTQFC